MSKRLLTIISSILTLFAVCILLSSYSDINLADTVYAQTGDLESPDFMFSLSGSGDPHDTSIVHPDIDPGSWIKGGINYVFERVITLMAAVIGGLSVLVMSYGGFMILSSAGDENMVTKGKGYIKYALIGLAVALSAYILVTAVQILIKSIYA
ncbi:hypothetical protein JW758_05380 [Candidatus Peregrinibacteria bacterium]|nr:hypothetical protein [Candidatus Peregrinibacteria bacterium]